MQSIMFQQCTLFLFFYFYFYFANVRMLHQAPVLSTISIGTFVVALLVEADLVECGVNIVISISASCSTDFRHLARASLEAGLHGFDVVINKQVMLRLRDLVASMYSLNSLSRTNICILIFFPYGT